MDQKHAGEPIGCLALVVGLVALGVAGSATDAGRRVLNSVSPALAGPPVTSAPAADASDTAPPEALATDLATLAHEARRLRDERMSVRKERMLGIAARHVEGGRRQYHRSSLRNTCRYAMAVALHYRDLDDSFVTRGWWEVAPGADVLTDAMTRERVFYVYAENQSVGRTLEVRERPFSRDRRREVRSARRRAPALPCAAHRVVREARRRVAVVRRGRDVRVPGRGGSAEGHRGQGPDDRAGTADALTGIR